MGTTRILDELSRITERVQSDFAEERRVLSFYQYLELFAPATCATCSITTVVRT